MKEVEILKDILHYRTTNETFYNDVMIKIRNPECRALFTQLRDDEMRSIVWLQQDIERLEAPPGIVAKIFPAKSKH